MDKLDELLQLAKKLGADVAQLRTDVAALRAASPRGSVATSNSPRGVNPVADDRELDSQYGNPVVHKDPPRWEGQRYAGRKLSDTEPAFLDCFAEFKEWQAGMDEKNGKVDGKGRPTAQFNLKDAARARGWAARLRRQSSNGPVQPAPKPSTSYDDGADQFAEDDQIPF